MLFKTTILDLYFRYREKNTSEETSSLKCLGRLSLNNRHPSCPTILKNPPQATFILLTPQSRKGQCCPTLLGFHNKLTPLILSYKHNFYNKSSSSGAKLLSYCYLLHDLLHRISCIFKCFNYNSNTYTIIYYLERFFQRQVLNIFYLLTIIGECLLVSHSWGV